jgi:glycosyltransferase involved in cell wall biosynthesis
MDFFTRNFNFLFEQIIARLPYSKIVTVSDYTKNCLIDSGISTEKISRIYNGLDYEKFNGAKWQAPENFTFTFFGRLGVSKGLDILIPAAAKFFKKNPDASLKLIIPTIPKKFFAKVKKLLEQWQISKQCEILNNLEKEELNRHLCSSSCVVVSSYSEGFCFAATEAIAMNIPVISSDKGALKEVISGRYIKLNSLSFKSLAEALQLAKEGKWTISPIKKFDLLTQVKSYIELYESMVK